MAVKQLSVYVENKQGAISDITDLLASGNVNLRSLCIADTKDFGILRLITDDTVKNVAAKEKALQMALRNMLGISPAVHLVAPKTIARSEGKAVRVIDKRRLHD